jgi:hypothetical protein
MAENSQWEYHIEVLGSVFRSPKPEQIETSLNEIGDEGWEVVSLTQLNNSNKIWVTMRRPLTPAIHRNRSRPEESW